MSHSALLPDSIPSVELDWYSEGDVIHVTARDQVRFEIQKDRAIEVLQLVKASESVHLQFQLLLNRLAGWIRAHQSRIENAFLTLQDGTLAFILVRTEARYDEAFQDELADLDFEIANDPDLVLIKLKTLALPNVGGAALGSFLDQRLVLSYVWQSNPTTST